MVELYTSIDLITSEADIPEKQPPKKAKITHEKDDWVEKINKISYPQFSGAPGLQIDPLSNGFEYFSLFCDNVMLNYIHKRVDERIKLEKNLNLNISIQDIQFYFGIIIFMGIVKLPEIRMYWKKNCLYSVFVSQKLSYKKFTLINRFFTFTKKRAANEDKKNYDEMTQ